MTLKSLNTIESLPPEPVKKIREFLESHQKFAITGHARPDGDSIGSALGLALGLEQLGKSVHVYGRDPNPRPYQELPGAGGIRVGESVEGDYDALIILECGNLGRSNLRGLERYFVINIDHHPKTDTYGDLNWLDPSAAAVGEMIYQLLRNLGVDITPEIATNLYVAIFTDTGSFQYSNTRAETFLTAGELVQQGADPAAIARALHMTQPVARIRLLGMLLDSLEIRPSGRIASIALTQEMLSSTGASVDDTEGMVNYPLSIAGVEIAVFFREESDGRFRISLRSKDVLDVGSVAEEFGGGGHKAAAGLSLEGEAQVVQKKVFDALETLLERSPPVG